MTFVRLAFIFALLACSTQALAGKKVETLYKTLCSSCHGAELGGGLGGSLIDDEWKHGGSDVDIATVIREGITDKGMPTWKNALTEEQIRSLVIYIREKGQQAKDNALLQQTAPKGGVIKSKYHSFALAPVASNFSDLWAMAFLPDGSLLTTEKSTGKLWHLQGDKRTSIRGIPESWPEAQGGLMEVRVLPGKDAKSPWVYLSYSEQKNGRGMTAIVRGKINGDQWQQQEGIFHAPESTLLSGGLHFGSRIAFVGEYVFFSIGDRFRQDMAQDLSVPNGKTHRLFLDGRVPPNNPFVTTPKAMPSIWSYGHRNPQGMTTATSGILWQTEHGPRGGDEVNIIEKGKNYGWPLITYGMNYDGTPMTDKTAAPGMEQPVFYWVPSIAVTAIAEYTGTAFPQWQHQLLVGSLAKQELQLLTVQGTQITRKEVLLKNQGRIRDIVVGPDNFIYLVLNTKSSPRVGTIVSLVPANAD